MNFSLNDGFHWMRILLLGSIAGFLCQCDRSARARPSVPLEGRESSSSGYSKTSEFVPISSIMREYGVAFSGLQPFMEPPGSVSGFDIRKETQEGNLSITFHLEEPFDLLDDQERIVRTTRDVWKEDALHNMRAIKSREFLVMKVEPALPTDSVSISSIIDSHGVAFSDLRPYESPPGVLSWFRFWKNSPKGERALTFRLQEPFELLDMDGKAIRTLRDVWNEETLRKMRAIKIKETILREFSSE